MTRALILAAGQGTRLRPLTDSRPKCLVPLFGKPLLERQLDTMRACGIERIQVATGYCREQIEAYGLPTSFNPRFDSTNMVESLMCDRDYLTADEDLLIAYGDIVYEEKNLQALLASTEELSLMIDKNWRALWSLRLEDPLSDAETLKINDGLVTELGKKPQSYEQIQGQYTGLIKVRADKVQDLLAHYDSLDRDGTYDGKNFDNMYMTSFLQSLIDSGWAVRAAIISGGWLEIDSVDDIECYEALYQAGDLQPFYKPGSP